MTIMKSDPKPSFHPAKTKMRLFIVSMTLLSQLLGPGGLAYADSGSMQDNYNDAADTQDQAGDSRMITGAVYSGASAVCTASCIPGVNIVSSGGCTVASVGAGGVDAVQTQQVGAAIQGIQAAGQYYANTGSSETAKAATEGVAEGAGGGTGGGTEVAGTGGGSSGAGGSTSTGGAQGGSGGTSGGNSSGGQGGNAQGNGQSGSENSSGNKMACVAAAVNALQAFSNFATAKNQKDAAETNRQSARDVSYNEGNLPKFTAPTYHGTSAAKADAGSRGVSAGGNHRNSNPSDMGSAKGSQSACSMAKSTGDFNAAVACAVATDPKIAPIVSNPNFPSALQKVTGMSPSDFIRKSLQEGPGKAIGEASGTGAQLTATGRAQAHALFTGLERQFGEFGAYTGGGSGGRGGRSGDNSNFAQSLQSMLAQFGPKDPAADKANGGALVGRTQKMNRMPANAAEDRRISIFERVTHRYRYVTDRLIF